jgi:hypothetical protein
VSTRAELASKTKIWRPQLRDPNDEMVLEAAFAALPVNPTPLSSLAFRHAGDTVVRPGFSHDGAPYLSRS